MVGPIDVKRKWSALVGYWVQYVILSFDLTHDLDLGCFKVKIRNNSITGIVGLIDEMKRKWVNMILGRLYDLALWPHPWPWPWSFKVRVWNSFISGMGWPIDMERKESESSIHDYMILTSVTMVGWADVPDSDRGDFGRRRAVDISSLIYHRACWIELWLSDYQQ